MGLMFFTGKCQFVKTETFLVDEKVSQVQDECVREIQLCMLQDSQHPGGSGFSPAILETQGQVSAPPDLEQ